MDLFLQVHVDRHQDPAAVHHLNSIRIVNLAPEQPAGPRAPGRGPELKALMDGQQRIVTLCLLLAAIRDEFEDRGDLRRRELV